MLPMNPPPPGHLRSVTWAAHPDALLLVENGVVVDANPSTEQLFGYRQEWLVGKPTEVLLPAGRLASTPQETPLVRAITRGGRPFVAMVSAVPLTAGLPPLLVSVKDVTDLVRWFNHSFEERAEQMAQLDAKERAIEAGNEKLTQYLFGAGIALRSCLDEGSTELTRERVERVIDVLDQVLADLNGQL